MINFETCIFWICGLEHGCCYLLVATFIFILSNLIYNDECFACVIMLLSFAENSFSYTRLLDNGFLFLFDSVVLLSVSVA